MSVTSFDASADLLQVTPAASAHFRRQLTSNQHQGVRISLKEAGCTGFKYVIESVAEAEDGDIAVAAAEDVTIFISPQAVPALRGTRIDYAQEGVNFNLRIDNPNVKHACGCGESFSID